jgi:hypothetical protein
MSSNVSSEPALGMRRVAEYTGEGREAMPLSALVEVEQHWKSALRTTRNAA